jgi:predicted Zn-dependent peptidase
MLTLFACLLVGQLAPLESPPRLRTILPNESVVLVERVPEARSLSVQLWISARGTWERPATHGYRHLLEHLMARGSSGTLDRRLETAGGFLRAETYRDAMRFELTLPPSRLDLGLSAIREILHLSEFDRDTVEREAQVMEQELAVLEDAERLAAHAWRAAYGSGGLDTYGNLDLIRRAPLDELRALHRTMVAAENLAVVVAGDVDLDEATRQVAELLASFPSQGVERRLPVREGVARRVEVGEAYGEARAAIVPGARERRTAAVLAAALVAAADLDGAFVAYTPTAAAGLVTVGRTSLNFGLGLAIDRMTGDPATAERGRAIARRWIAAQLSTPSGIAYLRGAFLVHDPSHRPEDLLEQIEAMTVADFAAGLDDLRGDRAVTVVGSR